MTLPKSHMPPQRGCSGIGNLYMLQEIMAAALFSSLKLVAVVVTMRMLSAILISSVHRSTSLPALLRRSRRHLVDNWRAWIHLWMFSLESRTRVTSSRPLRLAEAGMVSPLTLACVRVQWARLLMVLWGQCSTMSLSSRQECLTRWRTWTWER